MSLKVSAEVSVVISNDNVPNPQEIRFASGRKTFTNSSTYNESSSLTFELAPGSVDTPVPLGSISEAAVLFLLSSNTGITVKPVPAGGALVSTPAYELIPGAPCVLGMKIGALYASNPSGSAVELVVGAVGN